MSVSEASRFASLERSEARRFDSVQLEQSVPLRLPQNVQNYLVWAEVTLIKGLTLEAPPGKN